MFEGKCIFKTNPNVNAPGFSDVERSTGELLLTGARRVFVWARAKEVIEDERIFLEQQPTAPETPAGGLGFGKATPSAGSTPIAPFSLPGEGGSKTSSGSRQSASDSPLEAVVVVGKPNSGTGDGDQEATSAGGDLMTVGEETGSEGL
jgi:hypothetical protein